MRSTTGYPNPARRWAPPEELAGHILRPRLVERLAGEERVALLSAPPGYGKTKAARQWFVVEERPVAWFALDMVSETPMSFWTHFVASVRGAIPSIDDEPALLLAERGPSDPAFLGELVAQLDGGVSPAAVVIDDVWHVRDRSIFDGLAHLVDHAGHRLRFVIVCRSDPPLPLARWRSVGWLVEVREQHLRFTDDEAIAFASTFGNRGVSADAAIAVNTRVEGWPIGVHLALLSAADTPEPDSTVQMVVDSDRVLSDYLVAEVLDRLPATERDVALGLSVFDWFDAGLCADLLGVSAVPIAYELYRRRLFLTMLDDTHGVMRFHHLFRELLEIELRWREPERYVMLHRAAAALWRARGDLKAAYRHLLKVDDLAAACDLVVPLAIDLIDRGRRGDLRNHLRALPASLDVDDAATAFDLAMAWSFAGDEPQALRWCDRGERLMSSGDARNRVRNHAIRSFLSLMQGRIDVASAHVVDLERVGVDPAGPIERHFVTLGARVSLSAGRFEEARRWVDRARRFGDPAVLASVVVPSLDAWLELETGDLRRATRLASDARMSADRLGVRPHHGATEALIIEAWCLVASGHLRDASDLAELARADADELGWLWHRVRVGLLIAEIHRLRFGPESALDEIDHVRTECAAATAGAVDPLLDAAEATALIASGRYEAALLVLDRLPDGPRGRLIRAHLAVAWSGGDPADTLFADRDDWTLPERLEADVLIAATMRPGRAAEHSMTSALEVGHDSGWVSPFLGHGGAVDRLLRRLPLERVHPALSRVLRMPQFATDRTRAQLLAPLTPREISLLDLLPTHLSYAEIGKRLFLSVNTVKTNLKAMYRKLDVTSRAGAVDAAAALDLLSDHHYGGHAIDG